MWSCNWRLYFTSILFDPKSGDLKFKKCLFLLFFVTVFCFLRLTLYFIFSYVQALKHSAFIQLICNFDHSKPFPSIVHIVWDQKLLYEPLQHKTCSDLFLSCKIFQSSSIQIMFSLIIWQYICYSSMKLFIWFLFTFIESCGRGGVGNWWQDEIEDTLDLWIWE